MGAVQIEIIGYAASIKDLSGAPLDYLLNFIRFILNQTGIAADCTVLFGGSETAGVGGTRRLTYAQWVAYRGILGHQHVPGNDHWDPGDIPMQAVWLPGIRGVAPAPIPPTIEVDEMKVIAGNSRGYGLVGGGYFFSLVDPNQVSALVKTWGPAVGLTETEFDLVKNASLDGTSARYALATLEHADQQATIAATREITVDTSDLTVTAEVSDADKADIISGTVAAMPKTLS
jgi:hypothetical protein